jgi:hypothetical protein
MGCRERITRKPYETSAQGAWAFRGQRESPQAAVAPRSVNPATQLAAASREPVSSDWKRDKLHAL